MLSLSCFLTIKDYHTQGRSIFDQQQSSDTHKEKHHCENCLICKFHIQVFSFQITIPFGIVVYKCISLYTEYLLTKGYKGCITLSLRSPPSDQTV